MPRTEHLLASRAINVKLKTESSEAAPLLLDGEDSMRHLAIHHTWDRTPDSFPKGGDRGSTQGDF